MHAEQQKVRMRTKLIITALCCAALSATGMHGQHTLSYFIKQARQNSPLLNKLYNDKSKNALEMQRLKAEYTGMKLQAGGDFIFVPVVSTDNGRTKLEWNNATPNKYLGYDTGQRSSELQAGITLTKPLTGNTAYKAERERLRISSLMADNDISLNLHEIERAVTDQYILCLLDLNMIDYIDSLRSSVSTQRDIMWRMAQHGLAKTSDLKLLNIELLNDEANASEAEKSYHEHLSDLYAMCGMADTSTARIADEKLTLIPTDNGSASRFTEKFRLDSLASLATLNSWKAKYKPQVSLFVDGGLNTADITKAYRRFGMAAGVTFSWLLYDGKQKQNMERQAEANLNTTRAYRDNMLAQRRQMRIKYVNSIRDAETRAEALRRQVDEYDRLTAGYRLEMQRGDVSATTYVTVMRNKLQAVFDLLALQTNIKLMINALNYWNW